MQTIFHQNGAVFIWLLVYLARHNHSEWIHIQTLQKAFQKPVSHVLLELPLRMSLSKHIKSPIQKWLKLTGCHSWMAGSKGQSFTCMDFQWRGAEQTIVSQLWIFHLFWRCLTQTPGRTKKWNPFSWMETHQQLSECWWFGIMPACRRNLDLLEATWPMLCLKPNLGSLFCLVFIGPPRPHPIAFYSQSP